MELRLRTELSTLRIDIDLRSALTRLTRVPSPEHDDLQWSSPLGKLPGFDVDLRPFSPCLRSESDLSLSWVFLSSYLINFPLPFHKAFACLMDPVSLYPCVWTMFFSSFISFLWLIDDTRTFFFMNTFCPRLSWWIMASLSFFGFSRDSLWSRPQFPFP